MSKVTQSCNSYSGLSKRDTIIEILKREQRPITPNEICWISKADSRFNALNHNTVKVYCRRMLEHNQIHQPFPCYYTVTESRYGVMGESRPLVHDVRLVWEVGVMEVRGQLDDVVGGVHVVCQVGSQRGKVSATIGCDEGLDYHGVCFAVDKVRGFALEHGVNLDLFPCSVCCEVNEDYQRVRLDGVKCATVQSFLGDLERIYQKDGAVRSEVKVQQTSLEGMYTLLKGGVTPYNVFQGQMQIVQRLDKLITAVERLVAKQ